MSKLSIIGILIIVAVVAIYANRRPMGIFHRAVMTTEDRGVKPFTKLKLDGVFKTIISQDGGPEWVKVEADKAEQWKVTAQNDGETLILGYKSEFAGRNSGPMIVRVNVKDINSIINNSVGTVESKGLIKCTTLYLKNDAVGKTTLDIRTNKLTAVLNAVGATTLTGEAIEADIENNSVGKLHAFGLKAGTLTIKNKAVGDVEVDAEKEISINNSGVGSLRYSGPAMVKELNDNGVGKVSKFN